MVQTLEPGHISLCYYHISGRESATVVILFAQIYKRQMNLAARRKIF